MSKPINDKEIKISGHPKGSKFLYDFDVDTIKLTEMQDTRECTIYKGVVTGENVGFGADKDDPKAILVGMPIEVRVYTSKLSNYMLSWYKSLRGSENINLPIGLILINKNDGFVFKASRQLPILDNPPDSLIGCLNTSLAVIKGVLRIHTLGRPTGNSSGIKIENILITDDNEIVVDTPGPCLPSATPREVEDLMKKDILGVGFILNCIWKLNPNCVSQNEPMPKPKRGGKLPTVFKIPLIIEKVLKAIDSISYSSSGMMTPKTPVMSPTQVVDLSGINNKEISLKEIYKIFSMELDNVICNISFIQPVDSFSNEGGDKKEVRRSRREENAAQSNYEHAMAEYVGKAHGSLWCSILAGSNLLSSERQNGGIGSLGDSGELTNQVNGISETIGSMSTKLKLLITNNNRLTTALMQQKERLKTLEANFNPNGRNDFINSKSSKKSNGKNNHGSTEDKSDVSANVSTSGVPHYGDHAGYNTPSALSRSGSNGNFAYPPLPPDFMDTLKSLKKEINSLTLNHEDNGNLRFISVDNKTVLREYVFLPPHEINKKVPRVIPWGNLSSMSLNMLDSNEKINISTAASVNVPPNITDSFVVNGVGFANIEKIQSIKLGQNESIVTTCSYNDVTSSRSYILCLTQVITQLLDPNNESKTNEEEETQVQYSSSFNLHIYGVTDSTYYVISNAHSSDKNNVLLSTITSLTKISTTKPKTIQAFMCCIYLTLGESSGNDDLLCIGINGANKMVVCDMAGIIHCISNGADSALNVSTIRIPKIETNGDHSVTYSSTHSDGQNQTTITLIFRTIQKSKSEKEEKGSTPKSSLALISFPSKSVELVRAQCEAIIPTICTIGNPAGIGDSLLSIIESGAEKPSLSTLSLSAGSFETLERPVCGNVVLILSEPNNNSSVKSTEWVWLDWKKKDEVILNRGGVKATRLPICPVKNSLVSVCACGACCGRNIPCTCGGGHVVCFDQHRGCWVSAALWSE